MRCLYACFISVTILCGVALSQTEEKPAFVVADVHSSPKTTFPQARGPFYTSGRYELRFASLLDMIRMAYDVDPERVAGGPSWLEMDRFDVTAKIPADSTAEAQKKMLQALLEDRFNLQTHKDTKSLPTYALTVGKNGPKLTRSDAASPIPTLIPRGPGNLPARNATMEEFAGVLQASVRSEERRVGKEC